MATAFQPTPPDASELVLRALPLEHGQVEITNGPGTLGANFNDFYVHLSGYCGQHDPNTFAAAPEMLAALERAERHVETLHSLVLAGGRKSSAVKIVNRDLNQIRAAIAKARGAA